MATKLLLSQRLRTVKEAVSNCDCVADIGCDHGYVSVSLIKDRVAKRVIACDVNEGPLKAAEANIREAGYSDVIETRLSDGLHKISVSDKVDTLVIAGMGGRLMEKILEEGLEVSTACSQLVLQPQSEQFLVRRWIRNHGFRINKEYMVEDMGKFYWIIDAIKGQEIPEADRKLQELYDRFSGYLIKNRDEVLKKYINTQLNLNRQYLKGIAKGKGSKLEDDINDFQTILKLMQ